MGYKGYQSAYSVLALIAANALMWVATLAREDLVFSLGVRPLGWEASPWTIVTSMFIHASIWHLAANMLSLYFFGTFLCALVGEGRFVLTYLLGGLAGNLAFVLMAPANSIGIGASGAIFAVGGAVAVMRPMLRVYVFPIPAAVPLWTALLGGLIIISFVPNVAWQAHLGGVLLGVILGYLFRRQKRIVLL